MVQKLITNQASGPNAAGKKRKKKVADEYDSPWKQIFQHFLSDFLLFGFPHVHAEIDWTRPVEFLSAALHKLMPKSEEGEHHVDQLVKVWLKTGEEAWVLIHIEIQSQKENKFEYRVYVYNYRAHDRYKHPVMSLAILSDDDPAWKPDTYQESLWGCEIHFKFPIFKLLDYADRWEELEQSKNPFALVVMAHLKTQATKGKVQDRLRWKKHLIADLYRRGYQREQVEQLFRFIDWIMKLPDHLDKEIDTFLMEQDKEIKMKYISGFERRAAARAMEKGVEKGIEKGVEQGIEKGVVAQRETLLLILRHRFGKATGEGEEAKTSLNEATITALTQPISQLKELSILTQAINQALTTPSLEAFQGYLAEVIAAATPVPTPSLEKRSKRKRTPVAQS